MHDGLLAVQAHVSMIVAEMSDEEMLSINMALLLGNDPRRCAGYAKAAHLFDHTDSAGVPRCHEETRNAYHAAVTQRIGGGA